MDDVDSPVFNNPKHVKWLARAHIYFAVDLYKSVLLPLEPNMLISPFSVSSILAMTAGGARNETARKMKQLLQVNCFVKDEFYHLAYQDVLSSLPQEPDAKGVGLLTANRLFIRQDFKVNEDFKILIKQYYNSEVQSVDFAQDLDGSRATINNWVKERTEEKFPELVADGILNTSSSLVLVNAVYLKGQWESQFDPMATKLRPFMIGDGRTVLVNMMHQHGSFRTYGNGDLDCKTIEIPYIGRRFRMAIVLPNDNDGLRSLQMHLDHETLLPLVYGGDVGTDVAVTIPRFRVESGFSLSSVVARMMGMTDLVNSAACDLSGISESKGLFVSAVLHKVLVEVGECGSGEVAALSSSKEHDSASCEEGEIEFVVDRPFLFFIYDIVSGLVLFIGRVQNPATEELIP